MHSDAEPAGTLHVPRDGPFDIGGGVERQRQRQIYI